MSGLGVRRGFPGEASAGDGQYQRPLLPTRRRSPHNGETLHFSAGKKGPRGSLIYRTFRLEAEVGIEPAQVDCNPRQKDK